MATEVVLLAVPWLKSRVQPDSLKVWAEAEDDSMRRPPMSSGRRVIFPPWTLFQRDGASSDVERLMW